MMLPKLRWQNRDTGPNQDSNTHTRERTNEKQPRTTFDANSCERDYSGTIPS
jgi:hypothetical protein